MREKLSKLLEKTFPRKIFPKWQLTRIVKALACLMWSISKIENIHIFTARLSNQQKSPRSEKGLVLDLPSMGIFFYVGNTSYMTNEGFKKMRNAIRKLWCLHIKCFWWQSTAKNQSSISRMKPVANERWPFEIQIFLGSLRGMKNVLVPNITVSGTMCLGVRI